MVVKLQLPKPHEGQQQVIDALGIYKRVVVLAGRRFGKSLIAQCISLTKMLNGEQVAYITPTHQLGTKFINSIIKMLPVALIKRVNKTERLIELITGGSLTFYSGEAIDNMRGVNYHHITIDEAAFIQDLGVKYADAILPTLTDYDGSVLFISTPSGKDFFYKQYEIGVNGDNKNYKSFRFTSYDNPHLKNSVIDELKKQIPESSFNQEFLAIAGENASNPFGTSHINKNIITRLSTKPTVVYGIDVAKHQDYTVITGLDEDGKMTYFDRFQKGWEDTIDVIAKLSKHITKVIDRTGVGDVVFELLLKKTENLIGFQFTEVSKRELIKELIIAVEKGSVKYNQLTADEMSVCEYTRTAKGNYKFGAKSGYHDDTVMALALANKYKGIGGVSDDGWNIDVC